METFFIQTHSGIRVPLLDPKPEHILIEDIGWALSMQCRYAGHCKQFYSVAEHSMLVADICPPGLKFEALLHDAAEAYILDLPSPLKALLQGYKAIEYKFEVAIREAFGLGEELRLRKSVIKDADYIAMATEVRLLMRGAEDWEKLKNVEPQGSILAMQPFDAYTVFIEKFTEYKEARDKQMAASK